VGRHHQLLGLASHASPGHGDVKHLPHIIRGEEPGRGSPSG
jgi:hypothetical protein